MLFNSYSCIHEHWKNSKIFAHWLEVCVLQVLKGVVSNMPAILDCYMTSGSNHTISESKVRQPKRDNCCWCVLSGTPYLIGPRPLAKVIVISLCILNCGSRLFMAISASIDFKIYTWTCISRLQIKCEFWLCSPF